MTAAAEGRTPPGRVFSVTALTQSIRKNLLSNNAKLADVFTLSSHASTFGRSAHPRASNGS